MEARKRKRDWCTVFYVKNVKNKVLKHNLSLGCKIDNWKYFITAIHDQKSVANLGLGHRIIIGFKN
jgi:hypothetical protein